MRILTVCTLTQVKSARMVDSYGFWNAIKQDGKFEFTRAELQEWLSSQDGYSLQKPIRYKFKRSRIITTGIDNM
jgi:hypothetical protein